MAGWQILFLSVMHKKLGNEKIVVILTRNKGYRKKTMKSSMVNLYRKQYAAYPNLVKTILTRSFMYNKEMNHIERLEREGKIFVLRPEVKPVSRIERNAATLQAFYDHGYQLMEREYERLIKYLEV